MKKLLLLFTLLPSISLANELYMQCQWDGDSDIFEYHYSKKGGLNVVKSESLFGEVNYKKNQCKVKGVNLVCKKTESKGNTNIAHSTTINRFSLLLKYSYEKTEVVDGITDPTSISDKAHCVEVKAKL